MGLFTTREFARNERLCIYDGTVRLRKDAEAKRLQYSALDEAEGIKHPDCYMIDFMFGPRQIAYSIDPGRFPNGLAHRANHSLSPNIEIRTPSYDARTYTTTTVPVLWLSAMTFLSPGQELFWNYKDKSSDRAFLYQ